MPTENPVVMDVDATSTYPRMYARAFGAPGPGTPLIHDDLTRSVTWERVEAVLDTLRQYPDVTVTVTVLGTVLEYAKQPFAASIDAAAVEPPTMAAGPTVIDLR
jgi:hypothetical protein